MNQPIMRPMGPPPLIRQNAIPNFNKPIKNKGTNPIIGMVIVLILCIIIWLVFLKKDGSYSKWSEWSLCDKECGGGEETRKREYIPAKWGGTNLTDKNHIIEYRECNKDPCPIDGSYSEWSEWSKCSKTCGGGKQSRTRSYISPKHGGIDIPEKNRSLRETQNCNIEQCPADPAKVTNWTDNKDSNGNILYKDNNNRLVDINKINPIDFENQNFKVYKEQKRTFTKEGEKYIGTETLVKNLTELLNKKEITQQEFDILKKNGGDQIKMVDTDKANLKFIAHLDDWTEFKDCNPEKGRDRWKQRETIYYFPTGENKYDEYFTQSLGFINRSWNSIANLQKDQSITILDNSDQTKVQNKFIFTRVNNIEPKKYKVEHINKCDDVPYYTIDDLIDLWKLETIASCTTNFDEKIITNVGGLTLEEYSYSKTGEKDLESKISLWNKNNIIKEDNPRTKIIQCYGENYIFKVTPEMYKLSSKKNILQPGFTYTWEGSNIKDDFEWIIPNKKIKLVFQYDGHLLLRANITNGDIIWKTGEYETSNNWKGKWTLQMQFDGNLIIHNGRSRVWPNDTFNNPGAYAELLDTGNFVIKNKENKIIRYLLTKEYGNTNIFFSGSKNWKYCKNNASPDGILKDWHYYNKDTGIRIEHIPGRVTLARDNHPWGMTKNDTTDNERNSNDMIKPINISAIDDINVVHIVLLNKLGQRIYIEPSVYIDILNNNDKKNDRETIKCDGKYLNAINSYNINDYFNRLKDSSNRLTDGLFRNEWGNGKREPYRFKEEDGAWAWSDSGCTDWYNLAFDGNEKFGKAFSSEKDALDADKFNKISNDIYNHGNWLRDPRGESKYSKYWRVYYRTQQGYVNYLNGPNSPNTPAAFTNKSIFNNKCINDLEYFVNYRIKQKNKSNFANKLNNAYLEAII